MSEFEPGTPRPGDPDFVPYDARRLSYAGTFPDPMKAGTIRTLEWLTGKIKLLRLIRKFEKDGVPQGPEFWTKALRVMEIPLLTPPEQIARIPKTGPLVVVANHPHGLVDGLVLAELISNVRTDFSILTRSLLTGIPEIEEHMIPVPFPHEPNSKLDSLEMRRKSMKRLADGGVIVLFPAGVVASSETWFGPAIEQVWNPFTAKMIQTSGAQILPIKFPGGNTRAYQIANKMSATMRQGLLLHEIAKACHKPQAPVIGEVIGRDVIDGWKSNPRGFMEWLRGHTLSLDEAK